MFDFKSAVAFLRPFLELAIKKNYTKDEIFQLMGKVGWSITQNTFKYFWSLFLLEEEASAKKKSASKSPGKIKRETSLTNSRAIKLEIQGSQLHAPSVNDENTTEAQTLNSEPQKSNAGTNITQITASQISTQEKSDDSPTQKNGALFDIPLNGRTFEVRASEPEPRKEAAVFETENFRGDHMGEVEKFGESVSFRMIKQRTASFRDRKRCREKEAPAPIW